MAKRFTCSPNEDCFVELYVAGPDGMRGNGTRAYLEAYPNCHTEQAAGVGASRLLKRDRVRARMRELREQASAEARARLRDWFELAPDAQETLRRAAAGELRFPKAGRVEPEMLRSAVRSATEILDRALGTTKQMHEHRVQGGIVVAVAGPPTEAASDAWQDYLSSGASRSLPPA